MLHECTAEDAFVAWLRTERGVSITIDTSFVAPVNLPSRVTVIGSDGVLELRSDHRITRYTAEGSEEVFRLDVTAADPHLIPMQRWAEVVRDAVRAREAPPDAATLEDGLACAQVMDRLRSKASPSSSGHPTFPLLAPSAPGRSGPEGRPQA